MLRTYKPLVTHSIFKYQEYIEYLVCIVWCNATDEIACDDLISEELENMYSSREWVKSAIYEIYESCKLLTSEERADIREAFVINNEIEQLCEAIRVPVKLDKLPAIVSDKIKGFLIKCYSDLIPAKEKLDYYKNLIKENKKFNFCPCCGLLPIEKSESRYREDNDHYLPKAEYPFASVNFKNLTPLCSKCNKKCKSTKNPFENNRKSFYPFKPLPQETDLQIVIKNEVNTDYLALKKSEISFSFNSDMKKVETWNWLFQIYTRYNQEVRQFSKTELRILANRFKRNAARKQEIEYEQILSDTIDDYHVDRYDDRKFLKSAFLREMLNKPEWLAVYHTA